MSDEMTIHEQLLDSLKDPVCFCGTDHVIRYMNAAARQRYAGRPAAIGRSIFDCHNDESNARIVEVLEHFRAGGTEVLLRDDATTRTYMRAVRDADGELVGYYERYDPPKGT
jgi:DUF438 domain-containing protein